MAQCTARSKRTGERCRDHACRGKNVCYHHGGAKGSGRPVSSYKTILKRYSAHLSEAERELYEKFNSDSNLEELSNEVALARMKLARYMETRADRLDQPTLDNVLGFSEAIARIVEKRHKIKFGEQLTIRPQHFDKLLDQVLEAAEKIFGDDERYERFAAECGRIAVTASAATS